MAGNGFPHLDLQDLKDLWHLGNMAMAWARQPLALSAQDLTMYQELCHRYGLAPAEVLMEFQRMEFRRLSPDGSMPNVEVGEGSQPRPHPRETGNHIQQSGDFGWIVDIEGNRVPYDGALTADHELDQHG